ncbi:DUF3800 domain-containing protein [Thermus sediminis]|uniref:DUF3800 domain-containing protein n=1 Tax=Thermus sediminis TaxID=1761908 RepID=UPI000E3BDDD5|nr:DUF3800 domain-containing protein [Thermus sediminis]
MLLCFLDESGDHILGGGDPNYPIFVLAGVVVEEGHYTSVIQPEMEELKRRLFGRPDLVLRTADITRNRNGFEGLKDPGFRARFYRELNAAMQRWDYTVLSVVVDKRRLLEVYGSSAWDPYDLSLGFLVERPVFLSEERRARARIIAESRNASLDQRLRRTWESLIEKGTDYVRAQRLRGRVEGLIFRKKWDNEAGVQPADLVASPIGRRYLGKPAKVDWGIVAQKLRRGPDGYLGYGLVVFPKR